MLAIYIQVEKLEILTKHVSLFFIKRFISQGEFEYWHKSLQWDLSLGCVRIPHTGNLVVYLLNLLKKTAILRTIRIMIQVSWRRQRVESLNTFYFISCRNSVLKARGILYRNMVSFSYKATNKTESYLSCHEKAILRELICFSCAIFY